MKRSSKPTLLQAQIEESASVIAGLAVQVKAIAGICDLLADVLCKGGKILACGNGGSAAEAMHLVEELVGRFRSNRVPLPAVALATDATVLTCIGNDFGFDAVFSRQVEALGNPGDALVLFSTSGNSPNLAMALQAARKRKVRTVCILGRGGGKLAGRAERELIVNSAKTERIQEAHQLVMHLILDAIEARYVR